MCTCMCSDVLVLKEAITLQDAQNGITFGFGVCLERNIFLF